MKYEMPVLPYPKQALAPVLSEETLNFHYGKHLQTYIDNLNRLTEGTLYEGMELEEIICKASGAVFNNAAQVWNHTFYFESLTPTPTEMSRELATRIEKDFSSVEEFRNQFNAAATGLFGSGWAWLVEDAKGKLSVCTTQNADCPLTQGLRPLLTIDVWEHAYYIDYRNRRADYVKAMKDIVNWAKVEQRLAGAGPCYQDSFFL